MEDVLFWLYLVNAVLLINHEIDSAYWQEWELFRLPGGLGGFLLLHFPLLFLILYGLVLVYVAAFAGLIFSLILSLAGIFAFSIHTYFLRRGRDEFKAPVSLFILWATLVVSLAQGAVTILLLLAASTVRSTTPEAAGLVWQECLHSGATLEVEGCFGYSLPLKDGSDVGNFGERIDMHNFRLAIGEDIYHTGVAEQLGIYMLYKNGWPLKMLWGEFTAYSPNISFRKWISIS